MYKSSENESGSSKYVSSILQNLFVSYIPSKVRISTVFGILFLSNKNLYGSKHF